MSNVYNKLDQVRTSYETGLGKTASYLSDDDNFYRSVASSLINDSLVTRIIVRWATGAYRTKIFMIFM